MSYAYDRVPGQGVAARRMGGSSSLADVLNVVLDKGIVIDVWARVSVIGIEVLTVEARVVVASVETYLQYAEAIGLTALAAAPRGYDGRMDGGRSPAETSLEDQILSFLSNQDEPVNLGEMASYFEIPRDELAETVNRLVEDDQIRRDDEDRLSLPENGNENNGNQNE